MLAREFGDADPIPVFELRSASHLRLCRLGYGLARVDGGFKEALLGGRDDWRFVYSVLILDHAAEERPLKKRVQTRMATQTRAGCDTDGGSHLRGICPCLGWH